MIPASVLNKPFVPVTPKLIPFAGVWARFPKLVAPINKFKTEYAEWRNLRAAIKCSRELRRMGSTARALDPERVALLHERAASAFAAAGPDWVSAHADHLYSAITYHRLALDGAVTELCQVERAVNRALNPSDELRDKYDTLRSIAGGLERRIAACYKSLGAAQQAKTHDYRAEGYEKTRR